MPEKSMQINFTDLPHFQQRVHPSANSSFKRLIDIVGAFIGLAITAVIAIPIAIAIKLDNPGPVFYSQTRCGLNGKTFRIWKFRTMKVNADQMKHLVQNQAKGNIFKNDQDPRITRVGSFLRRTSLDELPQFWNVLQGDMSLVGTRPPTIDEVENYEPHHFRRLLVKPGITGEWQVNGRSKIEDFEDIVKLDLAYQSKWSVVYDLQLILKTLQVVLNRDGAY
ncbi:MULTISPECIES: sugar transferase [unclassified Calothrix]|uniref:sugar transferase n=1 Tax=unclassified Calothrix TaxID=2619626 RepID=UPI002410F4D6|nr:MULTISPECIES: exopolysaccharide biosynthesis polyprenyl glycosylphosphotransferase [unclassified Calothrix]